MGVYIPGFDLPKDNQIIVITAEGMAMLVGEEVTKLKAVQTVPLEMKDGYLYGVKDGVLYEAMLKDPSKGANTITINLPPKEEA